MAENVGEVKLRRCPLCGHAPLKPVLVDKSFEYGDEEERITVQARGVPAELCDTADGGCGESYYGPQAARVEHDAICQALGLLTPEEIQAIREQLYLNQGEFAKLTGIGVATISRWERGRMLQNKALDRYLRLVQNNPDNVRFLKQLDSEPNARQPGLSPAFKPRSRRFTLTATVLALRDRFQIVGAN